MTLAAAPVVGVALLIAAILVSRVFPMVLGESDPDERLDDPQELTPQQLALRMGLYFGGIIVVIALGTAVGVFVWGLSLEAVGFYGNPARGLAIGIVVVPVFRVFSEALIEFLQAAGQEFEGPGGEFLSVETLPELGWTLWGITVQASAEELHFRAALVGAPAALLSVSAWYFVVPAAVLFGFVHGTGGKAKIISSSIQGIVLGAVFVVGGLLAAAVVHVLSNQYSVIKYYRNESSLSSSSPDATQNT